MLMQWLHLLLMLILILISAELFTNALEIFGEKIGVSEGVVGSIFAAIVTALPETTVPILALVAGTPNHLVNEEISVGAILGAPLMLSTLSTALMAMVVLKRRRFNGRISPENKGFCRDLNFFLCNFSLATIALFVPLSPIIFRVGIAVAIIAMYILYLVLTFKASKKIVMCGCGINSDGPLLFTKLGLKSNDFTLWLQLVLGVIFLLIGAKGFIDGVETISHALNVSALLLSLIIIPIATELPEKLNSILWVRKNKDTLAFGNITGAMVFQGSLLTALGILLTPWQPSKEVLTGAIITLAAAVWLRLNASQKGPLVGALLLNGCLYLLYLYCVLSF